jgi:Tat protein secretion system quality control protein TatD with DNase activity
MPIHHALKTTPFQERVYAALRGVPVETIAEATTSNYFRLFRIPADAH